MSNGAVGGSVGEDVKTMIILCLDYVRSVLSSIYHHAMHDLHAYTDI